MAHTNLRQRALSRVRGKRMDDDGTFYSAPCRLIGPVPDRRGDRDTLRVRVMRQIFLVSGATALRKAPSQRCRLPLNPEESVC